MTTKNKKVPVSKDSEVMDMIFNRMNTLTDNVSTMREDLMRRLTDPRRDIDKECGYPDTLDISDFSWYYEREGLASRVVDLMPDESWATDPEIIEGEQETETEFEQQWKQLQERHNLYSVLHTADKISGVGRYGILLLGISDGLSLEQPVEGVEEFERSLLLDDETTRKTSKTEKSRRLLYVRPLTENEAKIVTVEKETTNPRFGLPVMYNLTFQDENGSTINSKVHWTRVIHLADNRTVSNVYGTPRMQIVFNRLYDLRKILGGSGEMFWQGGFPGLAVETGPDIKQADIEANITGIKEQFNRYVNRLQRYLTFAGMTVKSLSPQVADPSKHFETHVRAICISLGVPYRIFMGTEEAKLAGAQDSSAWNRRVGRRREGYVSPYIIHPLINRLMAAQILLRVFEYKSAWSDLNAPGDLEKSDVASKRMDAVQKYTASGASDSLLTPKDFFMHFLGFTEDVANAFEENMKKFISENPDLGQDDGIVDPNTPNPGDDDEIEHNHNH